MSSRLNRAGAALLLVLAVATGCTPAREPTESAPTFATEEEASAAAEETYRAYVDALNAVDLSDPETFEGVYAWTTGEANAGARKSFTQMHADGWKVDGLTTADLVQPLGPLTAPFDLVPLAVCLNVSDVSLIDSSGESVVQADRLDVQSMLVTVERDDDMSFKISQIDGREGFPTCAG